MKHGVELIDLFCVFLLECWNVTMRESLYQLHVPFWSHPALPISVCMCLCADILGVLLGDMRTSKEHLVGSSQPVVRPPVCSLIGTFSPQPTSPLNQINADKLQWTLFVRVIIFVLIYVLSCLSLFIPFVHIHCVITINGPISLSKQTTHCLLWLNF